MHEVVTLMPLSAEAAGYARLDRDAIESDPAAPGAGPWTERPDAAALAEVLDELDSGVIVCTEGGRIVTANDAARRELQRARPLAVDAHGHLMVTTGGPAAQPQCRAALRAAVQTRRRQLLALQDGEQRLMVAVTPLGQATRPWAVVLLGRRQPAPELAVEMLGKLCELTHSERSVLLALLAGERVEAVARRRGVKIATLRTQVGSLRAKLGARRLEDLVRLAAELPPMAGALRSPVLRPSQLPEAARAQAA